MSDGWKWSANRISTHGAKGDDEYRLDYRSSLFLGGNSSETNINQLLDDSLQAHECAAVILKTHLDNLEQRLRLTEEKLRNCTNPPRPVLPCTGTKLRVSSPLVLRNLNSTPDGTVGIGNSKTTGNPASSTNFLVFNKKASALHFLGTQSPQGGFVSFTSCVNWKVSVNDRCTQLTSCGRLPPHPRGTANTTGTEAHCSMYEPQKLVVLLCSRQETLVDLSGAIRSLASTWA